MLILERLYLFNGFVENVMFNTTRADLSQTHRGQQWAVVEGYPHPNAVKCSISVNPEGIRIMPEFDSKINLNVLTITAV